MITLISLGCARESIFLGEVMRDRVEFFDIFSQPEEKLRKMRPAKADTDVSSHRGVQVIRESRVSAYFKVKAVLILNVNNNAVLL